MKIFYDNQTLDIQVNDNSYRYRAIKGEHSLTLYFSLPQHIEIPVGAYCVFEAETYTLEAPENFKMHNTRNFEYTLVMESAQAKLKKYKFRNVIDRRLKFNLTARPQEHLQMLVDNLNKRESGWRVGRCVTASEKLVSYNHSFCNAALSQIADAFETEWEIDGKTINLHKVEYNKDNPLALSYGRGNGFKPGLGRVNFSDAQPIEILFVQGGERNINPSQYKSKELLLPKGQTLRYDGSCFQGEVGFNEVQARIYTTDTDGFSVCRSDKELRSNAEGSLDLSQIYPSRVGEVSSVVVVDAAKNFYDFIDSSIPSDLDFTKYIIPGETMSVVFQSGMLAGKEFDVKYRHDERRFEIVPQEIDGVTMPCNSFSPAQTNQYAVFGISLPEAYVCDNSTKTGASWDMLRQAVKYLYENEEPRFSFTGDMDGIWAKRDWLNIGGKIKLGGYILFSDPQFQPEGVGIRIVSIKDYVNNPHSPQIELSNSIVASSIMSDFRKIESNEVLADTQHKEALQFTKRRFRDAQETAIMLENALLENFSKTINPISVRTMQLLLGDESLQFCFVNSKTKPTPVVHQVTYNANTKVLSAQSGILQHLTLGINTLSSSHKASEYKYWDMAAFTSPALTESSKGYYLYAKVNKDNATGIFYLSEKAIEIEEIAGHYHLLYGILNSEYNNERSFAPMYGFAELTPGRLTIPMIVSPDGQTYFNIADGEIGGRIVFKSMSGENKTITELEAAAAKDAATKADAAAAYANKETDKKIATFGSTIIIGGYLKNSMIDTDNLVVKNIYSKSGKFRTLEDGTMYAVGGVFSGYIQMPFIATEESDVTVINSSKFKVNGNLNLMCGGALYEEIVLPTASSYNGKIINLYNRAFPPYSKTGIGFNTTVTVEGGDAISINPRVFNSSSSIDTAELPSINFIGGLLQFVGVPYGNKTKWIAMNYKYSN